MKIIATPFSESVHQTGPRTLQEKREAYRFEVKPIPVNVRKGKEGGRGEGGEGGEGGVWEGGVEGVEAQEQACGVCHKSASGLLFVPS